jgi:hypothetical protein
MDILMGRITADPFIIYPPHSTNLVTASTQPFRHIDSTPIDPSPTSITGVEKASASMIYYISGPSLRL